MGRCSQVTATALLVVLGAQPVHGIEGRILGSLQHVDGPVSDDLLRVLYDVGGTQTFTQTTNLKLRMSLDYFSRLEGRNSELWKSRFYGEFRSPSVLLDAQFAPWQAVSPGGFLGRQRDGTVGVRYMPARLPHLDARYQRRDRDAGGVRSATEDRWLRMSYTRGASSGDVGYRRVDTRPGAGIGVGSTTQEWRGHLNGAKAWRRTVVSGTYEGLLSQFEQRERRRELGTQQVVASAAYTPVTKLTLGANGLRRWGYLADNGLAGGSDVDEEAYGANVQFRATNDLSLQLLREYRRQQAVAGDLISDYLQGTARFRRLMARNLWFQSGYTAVLDLASRRGSLPTNTGYVLVDGRLARGIDGRAELRASKPEGVPGRGIQWNRLLHLRTRPTEVLRLEVEWRKDTQAEILGVAAQWREWHFLGGYEPLPGSSVVLSWRRADGTGLIARAEEEWIVTATHRVSERSRASVNWSRRDSIRPLAATISDVLSADINFWLPAEWQARANYSENLLAVSNVRSYGLILERRF